MKNFTTSGPVNPEDHYFIPHRLDEDEVYNLINDKRYFILHAPRQSGKTTAIRIFVDQLNAEGTYKALYINVEPAQAARSNVIDGLRTILSGFKTDISRCFGLEDPAYAYLQREANNPMLSGGALNEFLQFWSEHTEKPIILFIDEIDSLVGDTLISVLRQLRSGYVNRPKSFPQSVCLIGVRDVRDYRIWSDKEQQTILGGSAFNIKAESLVLADFSPQEVRDLYLQHTAQTGQKFTDEAIDYAFELTQGQPWLANALGYQACFRDVKDRSQPITKDVIERAKEELIRRQDTHLDVIINRLSEPRVRNVIDAIINGTVSMELADDDDLKYVEDLGLIKRNAQTTWIANPIYQEILPRVLSTRYQNKMAGWPIDYYNTDGTLDMHKLLLMFTEFFRENSESWIKTDRDNKEDIKNAPYTESGPHLILMAFLQRVVNGGGSIHREYALGSKRVDILVKFAQQRIVLELKINYGPKALQEGLVQTAQYMDKSNATEGHLIIFDRSKTKTWDEKIYQRQEVCDGKTINVWGM